MENLGEYIKRIRTEKGIGVRELSRKADISHSYLSQIENGNKKKPKSYILRALAQELEIDFKELMMKAGYSDWSNYDKENNEEVDQIKTDLSLIEESKQMYQNDIYIPIYLNEDNEGKFYFFKDNEEISEEEQEKIRRIIKTILN